jgi:NADH-quinone oxidoreductase subunit N
MNTVELTRQALFTLAPEVLLLLSAMIIMTAGAFVRAPRHVWCAVSVFVAVLALGLLLVIGSTDSTDSAVIPGS